MTKQFIAIGDEDNIFAYEVEENGQVGYFQPATDEEKAEFQAQVAQAKAAE
jgi:hypothetical protein